jgi:hypothetical protein
MVIISKFCNPENPGIEPQNPGIKLALKSSGIPGLDYLNAAQNTVLCKIFKSSRMLWVRG